MNIQSKAKPASGWEAERESQTLRVAANALFPNLIDPSSHHVRRSMRCVLAFYADSCVVIHLCAHHSKT